MCNFERLTAKDTRMRYYARAPYIRLVKKLYLAFFYKIKFIF